MKIVTACEHCQKKLQVDQTSLGKKARCPACKEVFIVQEVAAPRPSQSQQQTPSPPMPKPTAPPKPTVVPPRREIPAPVNLERSSAKHRPINEETPRPRTLPPSKPAARVEQDEPAFWTEDDEPAPPKSKPNSKPIKSRRPRDEEEDDFEEDQPKPDMRRRNALKKPNKQIEDDEEEFDEHGEPVRKFKIKPRSQMALRLLVLMSAVVGAGALSVLGYFLHEQYEKYKDKPNEIRLNALFVGKTPEEADEEVRQLQYRGEAYPMILGTAVAGLLGGLLGFFRIRYLPAVLLIVGAIIVGVQLPKTLVFSGLMIWAGLLSVFIRTKTSALDAAMRETRNGTVKQVPRRAVPILLHSVAYLISISWSAFLGFVLTVLLASETIKANDKIDFKPAPVVVKP